MMTQKRVPHDTAVYQDTDVPLKKGKQVFRWSLIMTAVFSLIIFIGLSISHYLYSTETIHPFLDGIKPWLAAWRFCLFMVLIGGWRQWTAVYAKWAGLSGDQLDRMLGYRWRMALWLLVMEAVFLQGILTEFVNSVITMESESL